MSKPVIVLMGAQRFDATLSEMVESRGLKGPFALITAGWQEREPEDDELRAHLGHPCVNLELHRRADAVFSSDEGLARAHRTRQETLRWKQDFYRVRLEHELDANHVIRQRGAPDDILKEEMQASIASIRALDEHHLKECARVHQQFEDSLKLSERASVKAQREELKSILDGCEAVAIAGGHVASLLNRLRMFGLEEQLKEKHLFAWSGGAMVLTERVVLFHDNPPQGQGASEVLDSGLGLVKDVVVLPQPEQRLKLDDKERVSVLASRFAPAACLAFHSGAHAIALGDRMSAPVGVTHLREDGTCFDLSKRSSSQEGAPVAEEATA